MTGIVSRITRMAIKNVGIYAKACRILRNKMCIRDRGIGSRLLDMAEEYAAALELGEIHLHVERDNHGARLLYQRRGFGVLAEQGARLLLGKKL